uniref:Uncharacterized protein n=2 Tax=Parascaris univalens TaxID=6257 RepID=A0A915BJU8_PARUN
EDESCISDGLFGECTRNGDSALILSSPLDEVQSELLRLQLARLKDDGYGLLSPRTQCLLIYFKLSLAYQLRYDADFCDVRNPTNVWQLLQIVKLELSKKNGFTAKLDDDEANSHAALARELHEAAAGLFGQQPFRGREGGDESEVQSGEAEEAVPLNVDDDGTLPLKKDVEHLGDQDTGLEHVEHKIVKGAVPLERVDSNHVYLRIAKDLSEEQLYQLVAYLERSIAVPNKLVFDDFKFDGDQLSFRVSRSGFVRSHNAKRQIDSAEGIAEAVYKRRKDIETLSGVRVDETGIGSGEGTVPVESEGRDGLFMPILVICAFTITALFTVLAVHQVKQRQRSRREAAIPELAEQVEGKPSTLYQDLCRHRMSTQEPSSGTNSKHSSTSSW